MLRLYDERTQALRPVGRPRSLTIAVDALASRPPSLGDLRRLVAADVLRRVASLAGARAALVLVAGAVGPATDEGTGDAADDLLDALSALNVAPPPDRPGSVPDLPDVLVTGVGGPTLGDALTTPVGPVEPVGPAAATIDQLAADVSPGPPDPLAVRLLFLAAPREQPLALSPASLGAAIRQVRELRALVAWWAEGPSAPIPDTHRGQVVGPLLDGGDIPRTLAALRALAGDDEVPGGAKFETFAYADRVLALDLARDVGRPPLDPPTLSL